MDTCIFCDIASGASPASVVYRDETCIAFMDIQPVTPGHLLVVPLKHAAELSNLAGQVVGHLFSVARTLAGGIRASGLRAEGINLFLADGEAAGQEVFHLHVHVFPRFQGDGFGLRFGPEYGQPVARQLLDRNAEAIKAAIKAA
jgi:diadenosine tetraphosphate (Ap4A) HIT family hydrolase